MFYFLNFENSQNSKGIAKWSNKIVEQLQKSELEEYDPDDYFEGFYLIELFDEVFDDFLTDDKEILNFFNDLGINQLDIIKICKDITENKKKYNTTASINTYYIYSCLLQEIYNNLFKNCTNYEEFKNVVANYNN